MDPLEDWAAQAAADAAMGNPQNGFHIINEDQLHTALIDHLNQLSPDSPQNGLADGDEVEGPSAQGLFNGSSMDTHEGYVVMSGRSVRLKLESLNVNPNNFTEEDRNAMGTDVTCHVHEILDYATVLMRALNRDRMTVDDVRHAMTDSGFKMPISSSLTDSRLMYIEEADCFVRQDREVKLMDLVREEVRCQRRASTHQPLRVTEGSDSTDMMAIDYDNNTGNGPLTTLEGRVYRDLTRAMLDADKKPDVEQSGLFMVALEILANGVALNGILQKFLQFLYLLCKKETMKLTKIVLLAVNAIAKNTHLCLTRGSIESSLIEILRFIIEGSFPLYERYPRHASGLLPEQVMEVKELAAKTLLPVLKRFIYDGETIRVMLVERFLDVVSSTSWTDEQQYMGAVLALRYVNLPSVKSNVWMHRIAECFHITPRSHKHAPRRSPLRVYILGHVRELLLDLTYHFKRGVVLDVDNLPNPNLVFTNPTAEQLPSFDECLKTMLALSSVYSGIYGPLMLPSIVMGEKKKDESVHSSPGSRRVSSRPLDSCSVKDETIDKELYCDDLPDEPPELEMMPSTSQQQGHDLSSHSMSGQILIGRSEPVFDREAGELSNWHRNRGISIRVGLPKCVEQRARLRELATSCCDQLSGCEFSRSSRRAQCIGKRPGFRKRSGSMEDSQQKDHYPPRGDLYLTDCLLTFI